MHGNYGAPRVAGITLGDHDQAESGLGNAFGGRSSHGDGQSQLFRLDEVHHVSRPYLDASCVFG